MTPERWLRVKGAIAAALAESAPERQEAALDGACGNDPALLTEARSILRAMQNTRGFLGAPAPLVSTGLRDAAEEDGPPLLGRTLGHYQLQARLGAGGMGEVFRARDLALGRDCAVKVLPRHVHPQLRELLLREADAAARLQHPAIATFFEAGEDQGETFIAMELVEGETLRARLRRGPLSLDESLSLTRGLLGALSHAHAAGLLHRDIKPENLMVTGRGSAKLLDFGIACALATPASAGEPMPAAESTVTGTAGYLSPEQAMGKPLDARSDLFQVAIVLYECLTGQRAFAGDSPVERIDALMTAEVDLARVAGFPERLAPILGRALSRDPERRYPTAMAFLRELDSLQESRAESAPSDDGPARRLRAQELVARAGDLVSRLRRETLDQAIELLEEALRLDPGSGAAHAELAHAYDFHAIATTNAAELQKAIEHADAAIALDSNHFAGHLWRGYALWRQDRWGEAAPALRRAVELAPGDALAHYFLGLASFLEGAKRDALPYLRRSLELEPANCMGWLALGSSHLSLLQLVEAKDALTVCIGLEGKKQGLFHTAGAAAYLAEALRIEGRLEEARARALEGIAAAEASDHPYRDTFRCHALCVLGRVALEQRDVEAARAAFGQVIAQLRARTRPRSCGHLMVQALAGLGRAGDAAAFEQGVQLFETPHTWNFERFNGCLPEQGLIELARAAHALGREEEAQALLTRAREAGSLEALDPRGSVRNV